MWLTVFSARIIYILAVLGMIMSTCVALFSPGWRKFGKEMDDQGVPHSAGLFAYTCPGANSGMVKGEMHYCKQWYQAKPWWEKAAIAFLIFALLMEMAALTFAALTFFLFETINSANVLLPLLALIAMIFLFIALFLYGVNSKAKIVAVRNDSNYKAAIFLSKEVEKSSVGYCFYMTVLATILGGVATIVGGAVIRVNNAQYSVTAKTSNGNRSLNAATKSSESKKSSKTENDL